ncbi:MAG TPA: hypothetical protein VIF15_00840 [Polyangiaceae bacterium]|jgi:hypothetical protein
MTPVRRRELGFAALLALVFGAAPTVGDVGTCGTTATDLDPASFVQQRKSLDCQRCTECGLTTQACQTACDPSAPSDVAWPPTCRPLQHDGEVCLRALQAASCGDYASFESDVAPTVPSECDFCHDVPEGGVAVGDL